LVGQLITDWHAAGDEPVTPGKPPGHPLPNSGHLPTQQWGRYCFWHAKVSTSY